MNADQRDLRAGNKSHVGLIWLSALAIGALGLTAWVQNESMAQRQWPEPQPIDWKVNGGIQQNAPVSPAKLPFRLFQTEQGSADPFNKRGAEAQWELAEAITPSNEGQAATESQPRTVGPATAYPWPRPIDTAIDYGNRAVDVSRQVTDAARQSVNQVVSDTAGKTVETLSQSSDKVGQLANQVAETVQEPLPKISLPNMQDGKLRLPKVIAPGVKQAIQQRLPENTAVLPKLKDVVPNRLPAQLPPVNPPKVQDVVDVAKNVVPKVVPQKLKVPDLSGGHLRLPQVTIPKPKRLEEFRSGVATLQLNANKAPQGQVNLPDVSLPDLPQPPPVQTPQWHTPDLPAREPQIATSSGLPALPPAQTPQSKIPNVAAREAQNLSSSSLPAIPPAQTPQWSIPDVTVSEAKTELPSKTTPPTARPVVAVPQAPPQANVAQVATPRIHIPTPPQLGTSNLPATSASSASSRYPRPPLGASPRQSQPARTSLAAPPPQLGANTVERSRLDLSNVKLPNLRPPKVEFPVVQVAPVQSSDLSASQAQNVREEPPTVASPPASAVSSPVVQTQVPVVGTPEPVAREHPQFAFPKSPTAEISESISGITRSTLALPTPQRRQTNPSQVRDFSAPQLLNEGPPQTDSLASEAQLPATQERSSSPQTNVAEPSSPETVTFQQPTTPPAVDKVAPRLPLSGTLNNLTTTTATPPETTTAKPTHSPQASRASAWGGTDASAWNPGFVMPNSATVTAVPESPGSTFSPAVNVPETAELVSTTASPFLAETLDTSGQTQTQAVGSGRGELVESSRVLAVVGDQPILSGDVIGQVNQMLQQYEGQVPADELSKQRQLLVRQALPSPIDNKLIFSDFMRNVPPEKLPELERRVFDLFTKEELPKLIEKAEVKTARALDAKLREVGSSIEKQRRLFMEKAIAQQMVRQNVPVAEEVKHDELLQYYEEHLDEYQLEARAKFEHLMVRFDKFKTREEARNAIATMGNQVLGGAPSTDVAKRSSHGPLASQGGVFDWTTKGSLASEAMDKALFSLPIGRWSKIIEDKDGFHIMRVTAREPAGEIPFSDVQNKIAETIQRERFQAGVQEYLAKLRASTHVWTSLDKEDTNVIASPPTDGRTLVR